MQESVLDIVDINTKVKVLIASSLQLLSICVHTVPFLTLKIVEFLPILQQKFSFLRESKVCYYIPYNTNNPQTQLLTSLCSNACVSRLF